jgi:hypothetical protein
LSLHTGSSWRHKIARVGRIQARGRDISDLL